MQCVLYMARAIGEAGDKVEQRRTDDVAELKTGVVFAMPEGGQLNERFVAR